VEHAEEEYRRVAKVQVFVISLSRRRIRPNKSNSYVCMCVCVAGRQGIPILPQRHKRRPIYVRLIYISCVRYYFWSYEPWPYTTTTDTY